MVIKEKRVQGGDEIGFKKYDLRKAGVNATVLDKALNGTGNIDTRTIDKLCKLLQCQPGDIMEYREKMK